MMESSNRINIEDEWEAIDAMLESGQLNHSPENVEAKPTSVVNNNYLQNNANHIHKTQKDDRTIQTEDDSFYTIYNVKPDHESINRFLEKAQKNKSTQEETIQSFPVRNNSFGINNQDVNANMSNANINTSLPPTDQVLEELRKNNLYLSKLEQKIVHISDMPQAISSHQENLITEINNNNYYLSKLIGKLDQLIQIMITKNKI